MTASHRFLAALRREPVDRTPVWLMRQAGRYLPEYRQLRAQVNGFMQLCKTPELACEVTLQPLQRFPLDAAILFSDILTIPDAMGLGLSFRENEGPHFDRPLRSRADIEKLPPINVQEDLHYVMQTIRLIKQSLADQLPLIGFSGSPWTLATYMVQGDSSKDFALIRQWLYSDPEGLHQLLTLLMQTVAEYLKEQIRCGVDAVMIFDTWGGLLTSQAYSGFSLDYMRLCMQHIRASYPEIPIILFTKNGGQWLEIMANSGCDALGIDWTTDIGNARERVGDKVALQGNLDPAILLSNPERIRLEVRHVLERFGNHPGHIFNLGHGVMQQTPPENVAALIEAVHRGIK